MPSPYYPFMSLLSPRPPLKKKNEKKKMPDRRLGIDMIFYKTSTKTYFNPPDYTHMHSRTDINQHGRQLIRSSSPSAVLIITPSPLAELNVLGVKLRVITAIP